MNVPVLWVGWRGSPCAGSLSYGPGSLLHLALPDQSQSQQAPAQQVSCRRLRHGVPPDHIERDQVVAGDRGPLPEVAGGIHDAELVFAAILPVGGLIAIAMLNTGGKRRNID